MSGEILNQESVIVHCTRSVGSLLSILENGFVFMYNQTKTWELLFGDINKDVPDINLGMVCFTAIPVNQDFKKYIPLGQFGPFGIAINYSWCLDNGMKPVVYIEKNGKVFELLRGLLVESIPKPKPQMFLGGKWIDVEGAYTIKMYEDLLLSCPQLPDSFTNPLYSHLIELLKWVETSDHKYEREYRIRSKYRAPFSENYEKEENIKTSLLFKDINPSGFLQIQPEQILYFISPKEQEEDLRDTLKETVFSRILITTY